MAIAWSTLVVIVLLLPGFLFLAGFYFPDQITRESEPLSAFAELAIAIGAAFYLHAAFYLLINWYLCPEAVLGIRCVSPNEFVGLLRAEVILGTSPGVANARVVGSMLDRDIGHILLYFVTISLSGFLVGWLLGHYVANNSTRLTRHLWTRPLTESALSMRPGAKSSKTRRLVRAHIWSKTNHDGVAVLYDGIVDSFYAKADGSIVYVVIADPFRRLIDIKANDHSSPRARISQNEKQLGTLFIKGDDIANIFFETAPLLVSPDERAALSEAAESAVVKGG